MSQNNTYLAVFLGSKNGPRRKAWDALTEAERKANLNFRRVQSVSH